MDPEGRAAGHVSCTIEMCSVNTPCKWTWWSIQVKHICLLGLNIWQDFQHQSQMFGTPWRKQQFPICLSRWGGRHWWNPDDPWPLQRLGLDQSTAGSVTHMSAGNRPHSSAVQRCNEHNQSCEIWNNLPLCFSLGAGLCAEEIHICGEPAAIDFIRELMYTTGEEVEVRLGPAAQQNEKSSEDRSLFCSLVTGPHIPALDSLQCPGPGGGVAGQPQARGLHRLL